MTILTALRTAATSAMAAQISRADGRGRRWRSSAMARSRSSRRWPSRRCSASQGLRLYDIDPAATAKCAATSPRRASRSFACASARGGRRRRARSSPPSPPTSSTRTHPHRQHGRRRRPHQRGRRRLPRQDRAAPRHPAALGDLRRISAADPHRGRDPAAAARLSGDRAVARSSPAGRPGRTRRRGRSRCSTASASRSRISRRCAICATSSTAPASSRTST